MRPTSMKKSDVDTEDVSSWPEAGKQIYAQGAGTREERAMAMCEALIDITAALFNVSSKAIRKPGRSSLAISRVRQVTMYVANVTLELNMGDIARALGRDRTTVLYACHQIEDLRDDEDFDRIITMTERVALAALGDRMGI